MDMVRKVIKKMNGNKIFAILMAIMLAATPGYGVQAAPEEQDGQPVTVQEDKGSEEQAAYISDEIVVVYEDEDVSVKKSKKIQNAAKKELAASDIEVSETVVSSSDNQGTVVVADIPDNLSVEEAVKEAEEKKHVSYAQPNYVYQLMENDKTEAVTESLEPVEGEKDAQKDGLQDPGAENHPQGNKGENVAADNAVDAKDTGTSETVNDSRVGDQYYLEQTHVTEAWETVKCEGRVTVAVLDTGCRMDHEDLVGNINADLAYDAVRKEKLTERSKDYGDPNGHGTHVCGLVAAAANNGKGIAGTSYNAKVVPVKVFEDDGKKATTTDLLAGFEYCRDTLLSSNVNLKVINMSVGYYPSDSRQTGGDPALKKAIDDMMERGVVSVCAGGNGDKNAGTPRTDEMYPSDFDECLSVTSLTEKLEDSAWSDYNEHKDISAPGENILSTYKDGTNSYKRMNGSSMATPIVSGICALIFAQHPDLSVEKLINGIKATANPIENQDTNRKEKTGSKGLIDASKALTYFDGSGGGTSISNATITGCKESYPFRGTEIKPELQVSLGQKMLKEDQDYQVYYTNNRDVGKASIEIIGIGEYSGSIEKTFQISSVSISDCEVIEDNTQNYMYTGNPITKEYGLKIAGNTLKQGKDGDYTVSYADHLSPGTVNVTIEGKRNVTGSVKESYRIVQLKVLFPTGKNYSYTGSRIRPAIQIIDGTSTLTEGRDYSLSYMNNTNVGTGYIYVKGAETYSGTGRTSFYIAPASLSSCSAHVNGTSFTYTGQPLSPGVSVTYGSRGLVQGRDYSVTYSNNINIGTAKALIKGQGNYTGSLGGTYEIVPKGTKITSLSKRSRGFKVKWKRKKSNTDGYQVQYSLNKQFQGAKTATIKKNKTTSKTVSKLKKKKKYFVRVRTFKKVNGTKYYSAWSGVKRVKTK